MLAEVTPLPVDMDVAQVFGRTRAELLDRGVGVPVNDLFIAATALLYDFTMVTHNVRHFRSVPNLRIADWTTP
jgi:tRNA(fMet)-specific endonuclease VapC